MNSSATSPLEQLARSLINGLRTELYLTPKPGLVDCLDNGSHPDLSLFLMCRSLRLVDHYLQQFTAALQQGAPRQQLVALAQQAEQSAVEQLGTNTHRGGIFLCGLLLVAAHRTDPTDPDLLQQQVKNVAAEFFTGRESSTSHGDLARRHYPRTGIIAEACNGLPAVFDVVLPLFPRRADLQSLQRIFKALAALMQTVDDSTSIHRCGHEGLNLVQQTGHQLEQCLSAKKDPTPLLIHANRTFRQQNLTMGGVADLLGVGLGYADFVHAIRANRH